MTERYCAGTHIDPAPEAIGQPLEVMVCGGRPRGWFAGGGGGRRGSWGGLG